MQCSYFDAGRCRSCTELPTAYPDQLEAKERAARAHLVAQPQLTWLRSVASRESGFRNKAKMVVGGTVAEPTIGILDAHGQGVDLRRCGLYSAAMTALLPALAEVVSRAGLTPYDVPGRRGELKHLLVTESPDGEFLVRFVLRSAPPIQRIAPLLAGLQRDHPGVAVVSVNLQPEHKAIIEGEEEVVLTRRKTLPMRVNGITLHLRPRSFFQTNTEVAATLYRQAASWADELAPATVWDLYCGVGGFALHLAAPGRRVLGVEVSADAVASATQSATELGLDPTLVTFRAGDATAAGPGADPDPDLVVVNPPRRGLGPDLAQWLERSSVRQVIYSSCNAASLARDLAAMPSLVARQARLLDMFPHTTHHEVVVLLTRDQTRDQT